jgi:hypothetical protein
MLRRSSATAATSPGGAPAAPENLITGQYVRLHDQKQHNHNRCRIAAGTTALPSYFVMICCGLSTGMQSATGVLGVWGIP